MTRPRGAFRQALSAAAWQLARERSSGFTWRELYENTPVIPGMVPRTAKVVVENMTRAGELQRVGMAAIPHARRPMVLLLPNEAEQNDAAAALESVLRSWQR